MADTDGNGVVAGAEAVVFFRKSDLTDATLSAIWKKATRGTGSIKDAVSNATCLLTLMFLRFHPVHVNRKRKSSAFLSHGA